MSEGILADATPEEVEVETAPVEEGSVDTSKVDPEEFKSVDAPVKPEELPDNFWDSEKSEVNVDSLTKSYNDLRSEFNKRLNDKAGESVDEYLSEEYFAEDGKYKSETLELTKDDPALQAAFEAAKDAGLGVKQTHAFIEKFMGSVGGMAEAQAPVDVEAEMTKLGKNAPQLVSGIKTWVDGMKSQGAVDGEVYNALMELGATAAGIKALDVLRQKSGEIGIPTGQAVTGSTLMSAEDWYAATFETHAEAGENRSTYDDRMREVGARIFGNGHGTFNGSGIGTGRK